MKSRSKKIISIIVASAVLFGALAGGLSALFAKKPTETHAYYVPDQTFTNHDADTYYNGINSSLTGNDLLSALRSLNSTRRKKTMGYKTGGTSASSSDFIYTDYDTSDPSTLKTDKNGQVYGTVISSFYSYMPCTSFNKEHVWPNTHGGNIVENDVHMARPTIQAENSNRGHSYYVENMAHSTNGWDPYYAFHVNPGKTGDLGEQTINSRGEAARITMYCMVATDQLTLEAGHTDSSKTSNKKMGDLETILKWNLDIAVTDREKNRNEGAEYLQGNRNPFIDHPEYACKIWGNTNSTTKSICASAPVEKTLTGISVSGTLSKKEYTEGESFNPNGLKVTATYSDKSTSDVTNNVTWSPTTLTVGTTKVTASYTYNGVTKTATVSGITVSPVVVEKTLSNIAVTGVLAKNEYTEGESFNPNGLTVTANFSDNTSSNVTNSVTWSPTKLIVGTTSVTASYTYGGVTKTATVSGITVSPVVAEKTLSNISVSGTLTKTEYTEGEPFDPKGLVVTAAFSDGTTQNITNDVSWTPANLALGTTRVTCSYTYKGVTKSATVTGFTVNPIVVEKKLSGLSIVGELNKKEYLEGEAFVSTGVTVIASFTDNTTLNVTNFVTWQPQTLTEGTTSVTASYTYEGVTKTVTISGIVVTKPVEEITLTGLSVSGNLVKSTFVEEESFDPEGLTITATFSDGSEEDVTDGVIWLPSTLAISTTSVTGSYTYNGVTKTVTFRNFTVIENQVHVTEISLEKAVYTLNVGDIDQLIATVSPSNATNKNIIYTSEHEDIVSIDETGEMTALKEGTTKVYATSEDGNFSKYATVTVEKEEAILVDKINAPEEITLKVGDAKQIEYTVLPENAANTDVTFTSSNLSVVTVNNSGLLNAVGEGEALVGIYSDDGNASKLISIKVTKNEEHKDDDDDDDPEEEPSIIDKLLGGCFGSIEATSILVALTALAGFVLLLINKAKRE